VSSFTAAVTPPGKEHIVFSRPATREELIVEYRKRDAAYDKDVAQEGIVFWYAQTDASGRILQLPSTSVANGKDGSVFTLAPTQCFGDPNDSNSRRVTNVPYQAGSKYRFRWLDGTDTGWLFDIGSPAADGTITVSWSTTSSAPSCSQAAYRPDFAVKSIQEIGCTGSGGEPVVSVVVENKGNWSGSGWVDLFVGLPIAPTIGTLSSTYKMSPAIPPGGSASVTFAVDASYQNKTKWVDALLDTTQSVAESNESNNRGEALITFGCSSRSDDGHRAFERPPGGNGTTLCNVVTSA
jgi:hypothetical protein